MKKLNFVLMSILTIVLTSVLVGCNFKKVEAKFTQSVVSISTTSEEPLSLDNLLSVQNVGKNEVSYHADKDDIIEIVGRGVVGKKAGTSKVYATYNKNYIASLEVIVRKEFVEPTGFEVEETEGKVSLSWAKVSDSFGSEIVSATHYNVKVEKTVAGQEGKVTIFDEQVEGEKVELEAETGKGLIYDVTVSAVGDGYYFDDGKEATQTVYVNFMPYIQANALVWNNGILTWSGSEIDSAKYQVKIKPENGVEEILDTLQEETTKDLTSYFDAAEPGRYEISVIVHDTVEGDTAKYERESEKLVITKLDVPELVEENGELRIVSKENVEEYVLKLSSLAKSTDITFENTAKEDIVTTLSAEEVGEELSGIFDISLEAKNSGLFYNNANNNLGKIYKLGKVTLQEVGASGATKWDVLAKMSQNLVDTTIIFEEQGGDTQTYELNSGRIEATVSLNLVVSTTQTTTHTFSAVATSTATTANGQTVFVVKSDKSNSVTVTDLADFQAFDDGQFISHRYDESGKNSIISFKAISGATKYDLYLNDNIITNYTKSGDSVIDLKLNCRLEELDAVEQKYVLKVVAKTDDDTKAINTTSPSKTITLLGEVAKNERSDNKETLYTWQEVENADNYKLEIYKIGYEDYSATTTNFVVPDAGNPERFKLVKSMETSQTQFDFASLGDDYVGYYYIRIYPQVVDNENYVVSGDCLHDKIAVATRLQLTLNDVEFGVDGGQYFLQIAKLEHVYKFDLSVGDTNSPIFNDSLNENNNKFKLAEDFSVSVEEPTLITLKAIASEDNKLLYEESQTITLTIKQIRKANFAADGNESDISLDTLGETLFVQPRDVDGMTSFFVRADTNSQTMNYYPGSRASVKLERRPASSTIPVTVKYIGSYWDEGTKLYTKDADGSVELESETNFTFSRAESPSDLEYYDGKIKFTDTTNGDSANGSFVLRIIGKTLNEGQTVEADICFDKSTTIVYLDGDEIGRDLPSSNYLSTEGTAIKIDYTRLIKDLQSTYTELDTNYLQFQEVTFSVFLRICLNIGSDTIKICSPDAKLKADTSKTNLVVKKVPKPVLSMDLESVDAFSPEEKTFVLSWECVEPDDKTNFVLTYGGKTVEITSSTSYTIQKSDLTAQTLTEIYVEATNPNYLDSDKSASVFVYLLRGIESVKLTDQAQLQLILFDDDYNKFEKIVGKKDDSEVQVTGGTEDAYLATISGAGKYTFGLQGKLVQDEVRDVYYLGSTTNSWTVADMSAVAPLKTDIDEIVDQNISWQAFSLSENSGLEYNLIFVNDSVTNKFFVYKTNTNKVNVFTELAEMLAGYEGTLKMQLVAHIKPQTSYIFGSTIYYSDKQELLNKDITKTEEYNYYIYKQQTLNDYITIIKLKMPEISGVEFEHEDKENFGDAQNANMKVTFKGNYGLNGQFKVFLKENEIGSAETLVGTNEHEGVYEYSFTIDYETYLKLIDDVGELTIQAVSDKADKIPSATLKTPILRAGKVVGLSFADDKGELTHELKITLPVTTNEDGISDNRANGGVVLKLEYNSNGTSGTVYKLQTGDTNLNDWSNIDWKEDNDTDFFEKYMKQGGTLTVSAFIKYFETERYILPSKEVLEEKFNVLKAIPNEDYIEKTVNGFRLSNATELNSERTKYIVKYEERQENGPSKEFSQELTSANNYAFVAPDSWKEKSPNLRIYATEEGSLPSVDFDYVLTLKRIPSVTGVLMKREIHESTFSWGEVSGAKGYQLNFYKKNEVGTRGEVIYAYGEIADTKITATELFGENYEKLLNFGKVTEDELKAGFEMIVTIVAVPTDAEQDISLEYEFKVKVIAQEVAPEDIFVDGKGVVSIKTKPDTKRIYTLKYVTKPEAELEKPVTPYGWRNLTQTKLDTEEIDENVVKFTVVVATIEGEATQGEKAYDGEAFALASLGFESKSFIFTNGIKNIALSESEKDLFFTFLGAEEDYTLYAGLESREIFKDDAKVAEINVEPATSSSEANVGFVYALSTLVTKLKQLAGGALTGEKTIYFWAYSNAKITEDVEQEVPEESIVAKVYNNFVLNFVSPVEGKIVKLGKNVKDTVVKEDYINTFAVFDNKDNDGITTLGFNVRITDMTTPDNPQYLTFITADSAKNSAYATEKTDETNEFALNITQIFEDLEAEDISGELRLIGKFKIEISKLTQENGKITFADWYVPKPSDESEYFVRLEGAQAGSVTLRRGDLWWAGSGDATQFYKIYFIEQLTEGTKLKNYNLFTSYVTYFNASECAGTNGKYYLAVQGVHENPYIISSSREFVVNLAGAPEEVIKNQITNDVKLDAGVLSIGWENSDFVEALLAEYGNSHSDFANNLTKQVFKVPFTFTMQDIINGNLTMSFEFVSQVDGDSSMSIIKNFDATILLQNLFETEQGEQILNRLKDLMQNLTGSEGLKNTIENFIAAVENGKHGIASGRSLFDDEFEKVQMGVYSLRYRLLGGNSSLSSGWYNYKNATPTAEKDQNKLYVNNQPVVAATKVDHPTDKAQTSFKVIFAQSKVYTYAQSTGSITEEYAKAYKVRLGEYVFDIVGSGDAWSMVMIDAPEGYTIPQGGTNVKVYVTGANGDENGTGYFMFYLNLNNGNSVLGKYKLKPSLYEMQIFAVGNDVSVSSKSEVFTVNFLSFDESIRITDGTFVWQPTEGRDTKVIYKKATDKSKEEDKDIGADEKSVNSTFALEGAADGLYDYIKFVVKGEIDNSRNAIIVDSSVYQINNILKLHAPKLSTQFGLLGYDGSANFTPDHDVAIEDCYSTKENMFVYVVYNDASYDSEKMLTMSKTLVDDREISLRGRTLNTYEVGKTGMEKPEEEGDENTDLPYTDYDYKSTEEKAEEFYMYMLGSDAEFTYDKTDEGENYYITQIEYGVGSGKNAIAVRSDVQSGEGKSDGHIKASMLNDVTNIQIKDGKLVWTPVTARTKVAEPESVELVPNADIVYRVTIEMYTISNADKTETNVSEKFVYYTADPEFDFNHVKKTDTILDYENQGKNLYTRATVQALSLTVANTHLPGVPYKTLIDGRFAYGSPEYDGNDGYKVLMGSCTPKDDITRIKEIDAGSLKIVNGRLTWNYTVADSNITTDNFSLYYRFIVADEYENEIAGEYTLKQEGLTFTVTFVENVGNFGKDKILLTSGKHRLKVYVAPGSEPSQNQITSFATEYIGEIEKLSTLTQKDYEIISTPVYETLDLSQYFVTNPNVLVHIKVDFTTRAQEFTFSNEKNKLLIITNSNMGDFERPSNYNDDYAGFVEISDTQGDATQSVVVKISFYVEDVDVATGSSNKLTSDVSEEFELERMPWPEDCTISWDEEKGLFTWNYDNFALKKPTTLNQVEKGWILKNSVTIYKNSAMQATDDPISLAVGRVYITNNPDEDGYVEISYDPELKASTQDGQETRYFDVYTNSKRNYAENWFNVTDEEGKEVTKLFEDKESFKIEIENKENTIIVQGGKYYKVNQDEISYPLFLVKVSYLGDADEVLAEYNISTYNHYYAPEKISDKIQLSIRIKRNENSIQSVKKDYEIDGVAAVANFNLFESGDGTKEHPYKVANAKQFMNIRYRMTRENTTYTTTDGKVVEISEGKTYYFELTGDVDLTNVEGVPYAIDGFLFKGTFDGNINGGNHTITYISKNVADLTNQIVIAAGDTKFHLSGQQTSDFTKGSALFETLSTSSAISSLGLKVKFEFANENDWAKWFRTNILLAGLAIDNRGNIEGVELKEFNSNFCAQGAHHETVILAFGGIVGRNYGASTSIKNCTISAETEFYDKDYSMAFFYGGVAAFNYSAISGCETTGRVSLYLNSSTSTAQIGGIACSSSSTQVSVIENCKSSFVVDVASCQCPGNVSGVVVCGNGKVEISPDDVKDARIEPANKDEIFFDKVNCKV